MNQEAMNKIIRKKIIWAEIKAKEQEYKRLSSQIEDLKLAQRDISFDIQKRINELEQIGEWMLEKEYEGLQSADGQTGT
jgi:acetyl-CoA carboxylase alpha subunit